MHTGLGGGLRAELRGMSEAAALVALAAVGGSKYAEQCVLSTALLGGDSVWQLTATLHRATSAGQQR